MVNLKRFGCAALAASVMASAAAFGASHREAPITALDHKADITDIYAFVSYDDPSKVTFILDVDPLLEPANGPNYYPFDPNVLYAINIDNSNTALPAVQFLVQFQTQIRAPQPFHRICGRWQRRERATQRSPGDGAWDRWTGRSGHSPGHHLAGRPRRSRPQLASNLHRNHG